MPNVNKEELLKRTTVNSKLMAGKPAVSPAQKISQQSN
jgi:hypothetical protein